MIEKNTDSSLNPVKNQSCAEIMLDRFYSWGIDTIFFVPGAQVDFFLSKAAGDIRFKLVMAAHETGAGYMADGFSRISGRPAVAVSINGPGAYNFTTAAATAKADGSRVIFLTGDAPLFLNGYSAFQCSEDSAGNSSNIFENTLGHSFKIDSQDRLAEAFSFYEKMLRSQIHIPVHFNLPCDFAKKSIPADKFEINETAEEDSFPFEEKYLHEDMFIEQKVKTVILAGEDLKNEKDMFSVAWLSKKYSIPVAVTMGGKNMQPLIEKGLFLGVFGYAGGKRSFDALMDPEVNNLIIFGASLNERNTAGWDKNFFSPERNILCFNGDDNHTFNFHGSIKNLKIPPSKAAALLDEYWSGNASEETCQDVCKKRSLWVDTLMETPLLPEIKSEHFNNSTSMIDLSAVLCSLNDIAQEDSVLFLDSGDHRIYGAGFWEAKNCKSFFTAARTAPLGWAICAAIGASFAGKNSHIFVLTGDGCMMMHGMEMAAASRYGCKIIFLLSSNGAHGRIAARLSKGPVHIKEQISSLPQIDWNTYAESMNIASRRVSTIKQFKEAIRDTENINGPFLIELMTSYDNNPFYAPGLFSSSQLSITDTAIPEKQQKGAS